MARVRYLFYATYATLFNFVPRLKILLMLAEPVFWQLKLQLQILYSCLCLLIEGRDYN